MKRKSIIQTGLESLASSPVKVEIDFSIIPVISFKAKNISDSALTGDITSTHRFNKLNIIHSLLKEVRAHNVDFYTTDFKDCSIQNSIFELCNFNGAAHINNSVIGVSFANSSFSHTSINDSEYYECIFTECDFTNTIISSCRFVNCKFIRCKTSNKLIESSLLFDCSFNGMEVQPEMIVENFGLTTDSLGDSRIRIYSGKRKTLVLPEQLTPEMISGSLTEIETFVVRYFLDPDILLNGHDDIDETFEFSNWLKLSKNPNRFRLLIERYHEFIMYNYERDKAPFWMILKLHKMTDSLSRGIDTSKIELYRSIMGVHMSLARMVENFLELADSQVREWIKDGRAVFLVKGPTDPMYYYSELPEIFQDSTLRIEKVIKHNSPNELHVLWDKVVDLLPLISLFLATRVKVGLQKLVATPNPTASIPFDDKDDKNTTGLDIIRTELGFDKNVNNYAFKLRAILPGDLLLSLHLELRTRILAKVKKVVLGILPAKTQTVK